jgi:site-specific DNA-methyltransferase (cytosine-N4-specific)
LPEFFIKFLTDSGDLVLDPFAGSNVTGAVAERLGRRWMAVELADEYVKGSMFRFEKQGLDGILTSNHTALDGKRKRRMPRLPLFENSRPKV